MDEPWWQTAVVYQIYPRSFCDASGDGVGDLAGLRRHLDHLVDLGVDALWLSPTFPSPMADFGYDVSAYDDVDPVFGSLADMDGLVEEAHARNLKVLLDWVPNHTSIEHPWFREHPDFYVWVDGEPSTPPNGWRAAFDRERPAWTWSEEREQWYLHLFLPEQPDLDWSNPDVEAAMHETLRFWLRRGIDGFRMDVVHLIGKGHDLPDLDDEQALGPVVHVDVPRTHDLLRRIRAVLDEHPGSTSVGEVYLLDTERVATYLGSADSPELHLSFNFPALWQRWGAAGWRRRIDDVEEHFAGADRWPTWVLSNHDVPRHRTRLGSEERARSAAVLLTTLRGTPFLFAGEELGLEDALVSPERVVDPGGRDGCRAPIPWTGGSGHGWAGGDDAWLPWPPDAATRNVEAQEADPASMLHLYRRLLAARRGSPALRAGRFTWVDGQPDDLLVYERRSGDDVRRVAVNMGGSRLRLEVTGWELEVAAWDGVLGPDGLAADGAVVLRPERLS
jgi:alpha-glucosidase